jgi:glycosyltransferase involved in cell wall biosynthesis
MNSETPPGVVINGKFLSAAPTAVHRVAYELTRALGEHSPGRNVSIAVPPGSPLAWPAPDMPIKVVGHLNGIAWEQLSLPGALQGQLLVSFCNMTPFTVRSALTMVHDAQVFTTPRSYGRMRSAWARLHIRLAGSVQLGLLTVSEFAKRELVSLGIAPAERIHVIHNGVDHVLRIIPDHTVLNRLGLTPRHYALALANLQPHKNIGLLLQAFARPALAGLTLVLTGRARAADFAAAGFPLPANVVFAGYVSEGEMCSLQAHALAVCTPSLTEGFGLPPVEGMLLGTPALIAPCGALPEVCGQGALQVDPHDPAAWEHALLRLQNEPLLWQGLSDAGRAFAARFTWDAAARKLIAVIAQVTAELTR